MLNVKPTTIGFWCCILLLGTAYQPLAIAASTLTQTQESALFDRDRYVDFQLNPTGTKLALILETHDSPDRSAHGGDSKSTVNQQIFIIDLATNSRSQLFSSRDFFSTPVSITSLNWIDNNQLYLALNELTDGIAELSDTKNANHRLVLDTNDIGGTTRFIQTEGDVISTLPSEPNKILVALSGSKSYVYRIDTQLLNQWGKPLGKTAKVDGGVFTRTNRITEVDGYSMQWLANAQGQVQAVMYWNPESGVHLSVRQDNNDEWGIESTWRAKKRKGSGKRRNRQQQLRADLKKTDFELIAQLPNSREFVVLTEAPSGRQALYKTNLSTLEKELIYEHPTAQILGVTLDRSGSQLVSARYFEGGYLRQHYFAQTGAKVTELIAKKYPNYLSLVGSSSTDQTTFATYLHVGSDPGRIVIVWPESAEIREIVHIAPKFAAIVDTAQLAQGQARTVKVGSLDVEYYYTKPNRGTTHGLIVFPHGGPYGVLDELSFNPDIQYLVAQGYGVLQVNFRGSGGYGKAFAEAGKGEFGRSMLEDIEAAMADLKTWQSIPPRTCMLGESYGGYAALMLALRDPRNISCVVTFAGVYDLPLLLANSSGEARKFFLDLFVTKSSGSDDEIHRELLRLSPLYQTQALAAPIFIAHGANDRVVDVDHAWRLKRVLEQQNKTFRWQLYPDEAHGFKNGERRLRHMQEVAAFLKPHLTGSPQNSPN